jgi:hypothetical protein
LKKNFFNEKTLIERIPLFKQKKTDFMSKHVESVSNNMDSMDILEPNELADTDLILRSSQELCDFNLESKSMFLDNNNNSNSNNTQTPTSSSPSGKIESNSFINRTNSSNNRSFRMPSKLNTAGN